MPEGGLITVRLFRMRAHQHRTELGIVADRLDQVRQRLFGERHAVRHKGRIDQRGVEIDDRLAGGQLLFNFFGAPCRALVELIERSAKGAHRLGVPSKEDRPGP